MTHSGREPDWSRAQRRGPTVRIESQQATMSAGALHAHASRSHAKVQSLNMWILMSLLVASTTLALYDLYLLASVLAGN